MKYRILSFLPPSVHTRLTFVLAFWVIAAVPASAGTITWFASGTISRVIEQPSEFGFAWDGLVAGTPWSMELTFDPAGPRSGPFGSGGNCYTYGINATTFTLGGFTYTNTGQILTNTAPHFGCVSPNDGRVGIMHFWWPTAWTHEPGAWDISGLMVAAYRDLLATDGSLPLVPTLHPNQTAYAGMFNQRCCPAREFTAGFRPTAFEQPTAVPEPATVTMFGVGLAALAARRRRRD